MHATDGGVRGKGAAGRASGGSSKNKRAKGTWAAKGTGSTVWTQKQLTSLVWALGHKNQDVLVYTAWTMYVSTTSLNVHLRNVLDQQCWVEVASSAFIELRCLYVGPRWKRHRRKNLPYGTLLPTDEPGAVMGSHWIPCTQSFCRRPVNRGHWS